MMTYAELVFHVLAHVEPPVRLNASLFHPKYVEFCCGALGVSGERALGEDAIVLGRLLRTHELLAGVQLLAWFFDSAEEAARFEELEIVDFPQEGPFRREILRQLRGGDLASLELLRCAVALEAEHYARLPPAERGGEESVTEELQALLDVAPRLGAVTVKCCRALGLRGRVWGDCLFVGLPEPLPYAPSAQHAALQAAHEATVQEVSGARRMSFFETELSALTLLSLRMRGHKKDAEHKRWLASLDLSQFGGSAKLGLEYLAPESQKVVASLLKPTS